VINLSLGGVRDPLNPQLDTYSPLEAAAVEYASSKGALLVGSDGDVVVVDPGEAGELVGCLLGELLSGHGASLGAEAAAADPWEN